MNKRDDDAAAAWIGAGVAFGVSTAAGVWGSSVLLLSGPVGWIALGIGFALVAAAYWFTDTKLEYFFKHFLLSDQAALPKGDRTPMEYNRYVYAQRFVLVDYDEDEEVVEKLIHPTNAIAFLHDMIVCNQISYFVPREGYGKLIGYGHGAYRIAYEFSLKVNFHQFLDNPDQVEVMGILTTKGRPTIAFAMDVPRSSVATLENKQRQWAAELSIPERYRDQIDRFSTLVLALRLRISERNNHYFPYPFTDQQPRYVAARFRLNRGRRNLQAEGEQEVVFGTLETLANEDTW